MPIVSFIPYYPDEKVDRATAKFHLWNWWRHREKRVPDLAIRTYLDKYFALYRRAEGGVERRIAIIPGLRKRDFSKRITVRYVVHKIAKFHAPKRVVAEILNDGAAIRNRVPP
jgi:hypothetical protein